MDLELIKSTVGTIVRNAVAPLIVIATAKGWITSEDATQWTVIIVTTVSVLIWGLVQKVRANKAVKTALQLPAGASMEYLKENLSK